MDKTLVKTFAILSVHRNQLREVYRGIGDEVARLDRRLAEIDRAIAQRDIYDKAGLA